MHNYIIILYLLYNMYECDTLITSSIYSSITYSKKNSFEQALIWALVLLLYLLKPGKKQPCGLK